MKNSTNSAILLMTGLLAVSGCSKKEAVSTAPPADTGTAVAPTPTDATVAPTPSPTEAPAPQPNIAVEVAQPPPQGVSAADRTFMVQQAQKQLQKVKFPKNDQERFERNLQWLTLIRNGDAAKKAEILKEIRGAGLTPQEAAELEKLRQYYGVKF